MKYRVPAEFVIVSGGQTGADRAALDWAMSHGVPHGGWCPRGRRTEEGPLAPQYLLRETPSRRYLERTEWNVRDSDATLIFTLGGTLQGGSARTADFARVLGKPWLCVEPGAATVPVARFLAERHVVTLNVAGTRASRAPGIERLVFQVLDGALDLSDMNRVTTAGTVE